MNESEFTGLLWRLPNGAGYFVTFADFPLFAGGNSEKAARVAAGEAILKWIEQRRSLPVAKAIGELWGDAEFLSDIAEGAIPFSVRVPGLSLLPIEAARQKIGYVADAGGMGVKAMGNMVLTLLLHEHLGSPELADPFGAPRRTLIS